MDINDKNNNRDKTNYVLKNYGFQIVKFDVFSLVDGIKKSIIEYKLLVHENRICIDYKIEFKQIYANYKTTGSHKEKYFNCSNNSTYQVRKDFLKKLGKSHCFSENRKDKDYFLITDKNKLSEINNYLSSIELKNVTFQNIEYILTGCNPSGQDSGRGHLKLKYDDEYLPFGFFLKSINKIKKRNKLFDDNKEEISWERIWKKSEDKIISFEDFLSKNGKLQDLFIKFRDNPKNWKNIFEECKKYFLEQTDNLIEINNGITKYRIEGKKNFENQYGSNRVNAIKKIFEISHIPKIKLIASTIQYAHIYPVWAIKDSILKLDKSQKEERNYLFEMISDKDNFLPLDVETHTLYDRNELFWDQDGKLNKLALENNENYEDKLYIYSKISSEILNTTNIKTYLTKFIELNNK